MYDPYAGFESMTMSNGIEVYALQKPDRPWQAVQVLIRGGASDDPEGYEGVAHFLEHTVSENAILPEKDIKKFFEEHGGDVNLGLTSYWWTSYGFFAPAEKKIVKEAFSIFGSMLLTASITEGIEESRDVIVQEFLRDYGNETKLEFEKRKHAILYAGTLFEKRFENSRKHGINPEDTTDRSAGILRHVLHTGKHHHH